MTDEEHARAIREALETIRDFNAHADALTCFKATQEIARAALEGWR